MDYALRQRLFEKLSYIALSSKVEEIEPYLKPFLDNFKSSREVAQFFSAFISAEDRLMKYDQFWAVWNLFYPKVVVLAQRMSSWSYSNEVIYNYLLAWSYWRKDAREWHSLKDREKIFFKKASEDMGRNPAVLYSLSKFLTDIGTSFMDEGILWISDMLKNNPDLSTAELEVNTIYYLENLVRSYILKNRQKIKTTLKLKNKILVILDFLLAKGSVAAYLLREDIL